MFSPRNSHGHLDLLVVLSVVALSAGGQVQVTVSPSTANVPIGGSQQFTATVAGTDDRDVTWSVQEGNGAGAIDSGGGYYPGAAAGTFHVVATSVADRTAMGTAAVLVPGFIYNNLLAPRDRYAATLLLTGEVLITGGNNPGTFPDAELYDPGTNTSSAIGDMNTSRPLGGHTATRLQDGTVLIAGGQTASAETYDPVMMVFSPTSSMSIARCRHTATLLPNGNVLIAGGYSDSGTVCGGFALATAELYSPVTGMFTPTGRMNTPRGDHTASLLPTGQVLIAGGNNGAGVVVATAELYDPIRGTFTPAGTMGTPRNRHTATLLQNGKVLVAGGLASGDDFPLATAELYDPVSGMFAATGGMMAGRQSHTATLLPNGNVLVADKTADLYDPGTGVFSATGALMTLHRRATATLLPNAEVWIPGGFDGNGGSAAAELYDPARGIFHSSLMSMGRISASATMLQNGKVLVAGGSSSPGTDLYDPATGTFAATASMSTGRFSATATLLQSGKVLIAGGSTVDGHPFASAEVYDPMTGTFTPTGSMSAARYSHTATALPTGKVFIAGGYSTAGTVATAELYDPVSGMFAATGSMMAARLSHTATLLPNGKVLIAGGLNESGTVAAAELYDSIAGTFAATGSMTAARQSHTATLLPDGTVLMAGGCPVSACTQARPALASAEIYDPTAGNFAATGSMTSPRANQVAALLPNDQVLIVGGDTSTFPGTAESYDPTAGTFTLIDTLSLTNLVPSHGAAVLLPNNQVLIVANPNTAVLSANAQIITLYQSPGPTLEPAVRR